MLIKKVIVLTNKVNNQTNFGLLRIKHAGAAISGTITCNIGRCANTAEVPFLDWPLPDYPWPEFHPR